MACQLESLSRPLPQVSSYMQLSYSMIVGVNDHRVGVVGLLPVMHLEVVFRDLWSGDGHCCRLRGRGEQRECSGGRGSSRLDSTHLRNRLGWWTTGVVPLLKKQTEALSSETVVCGYPQSLVEGVWLSHRGSMSDLPLADTKYELPDEYFTAVTDGDLWVVVSPGLEDSVMECVETFSFLLKHYLHRPLGRGGVHLTRFYWVYPWEYKRR
jgi:hypothetical protein